MFTTKKQLQIESQISKSVAKNLTHATSNFSQISETKKQSNLKTDTMSRA